MAGGRLERRRAHALAAYQEALNLSGPLAAGPRATASARASSSARAVKGSPCTLPGPGRSTERLAHRRAAQAIWEGLVGATSPPSAPTAAELALSQIARRRISWKTDGPAVPSSGLSRRALAILEVLAV